MEVIVSQTHWGYASLNLGSERERNLQTQMADDDDEEETNSSFYKIHHNPALNYIYDDIILMNIRHDL